MKYLIIITMLTCVNFWQIYRAHTFQVELHKSNIKMMLYKEMANDPNQHKDLILLLKHKVYVIKNGFVVEHEKDWR